MKKSQPKPSAFTKEGQKVVALKKMNPTRNTDSYEANAKKNALSSNKIRREAGIKTLQAMTNMNRMKADEIKKDSTTIKIKTTIKPKKK